MPIDRNNRGPRNRNRISLNEDYEVRYWAQKFGVTEEELKAAVKRTGTAPRRLSRNLRKRRHRDSPRRREFDAMGGRHMGDITERDTEDLLIATVGKETAKLFAGWFRSIADVEACRMALGVLAVFDRRTHSWAREI